MNYDILIPCAKKDEDTLDICIKSCKKRIKNTIENIYIVSNINNEKIKQIALNNGCIFVDEDKVLDVTLDDLQKIKLWNRWGWLFQQFLKMSGKITKNDNFIVVDSEVAFLSDIIFDINNEPIFYWNNTFHHPPYFEMLNKLLGIIPDTDISYVTDFMIFNKSHLKCIKDSIEKTTGTDWINGIINNIDFSESPFSEFETYGFSYIKPHIVKYIKYKPVEKLYTDLSKIENDYNGYDVIVMHKWLRNF